jgi:hypothetical protein
MKTMNADWATVGWGAMAIIIDYRQIISPSGRGVSALRSRNRRALHPLRFALTQSRCQQKAIVRRGRSAFIGLFPGCDSFARPQCRGRYKSSALLWETVTDNCGQPQREGEHLL